MPQHTPAKRRANRARKAKKSANRLGGSFGGLVGRARKAIGGRRRVIDDILKEAQGR